MHLKNIAFARILSKNAVRKISICRNRQDEMFCVQAFIAACFIDYKTRPRCFMTWRAFAF